MTKMEVKGYRDNIQEKSIDNRLNESVPSQDIENTDYIKEIKFNNFIDILIEIITENNIGKN